MHAINLHVSWKPNTSFSLPFSLYFLDLHWTLISHSYPAAFLPVLFFCVCYRGTWGTLTSFWFILSYSDFAQTRPLFSLILEIYCPFLCHLISDRLVFSLILPSDDHFPRLVLSLKPPLFFQLGFLSIPETREIQYWNFSLPNSVYLLVFFNSS